MLGYGLNVTTRKHHRLSHALRTIGRRSFRQVFNVYEASESDMPMTYERDYLFGVMEDDRGHKVKAGIPKRAVN